MMMRPRFFMLCCSCSLLKDKSRPEPLEKGELLQRLKAKKMRPRRSVEGVVLLLLLSLLLLSFVVVVVVLVLLSSFFFFPRAPQAMMPTRRCWESCRGGQSQPGWTWSLKSLHCTWWV